MNILSSPQMLLAATAAVLLSGGSTGDAVARSQPAAVCPPATAAAVPADYWVYHALVAPYPTLTPPVSAAPRVRTACTAYKVIRT
ncbi:MAG TPA: hypothetical protein VN283_01755 [Thiobacillus sp.]|nr:hypothetical protein [Thiobacillus sp.]